MIFLLFIFSLYNKGIILSLYTRFNELRIEFYVGSGVQRSNVVDERIYTELVDQLVDPRNVTIYASNTFRALHNKRIPESDVA